VAVEPDAAGVELDGAGAAPLAADVGAAVDVPPLSLEQLITTMTAVLHRSRARPTIGRRAGGLDHGMRRSGYPSVAVRRPVADDVQPAACGVWRVACGVRRVACGVTNVADPQRRRRRTEGRTR
jgi:hypothetical protein